MTNVSLVGLGSMGAALGRALLSGGRGLTVWNRNAAKAAPLVAAGAAVAPDLASAVAASPILVICIDDYAATRAILEAPEVSRQLAGRTVVQLSTGTPNEAREAEAWFRDRGATYLDGAIMVFPDGIGAPDTLILFAGTDTTWLACRETLQPLGGSLRHVGSRVGAAAALDFAFLTRYLGMALGVAHGAYLCQAEGVDLSHFSDVLVDGTDSGNLAKTIASGNYAETGARMSVWRHALQRIRVQVRDAGIGSDVPDFIESIFARAVARGHGDHDVAALIKGLDPA